MKRVRNHLFVHIRRVSRHLQAGNVKFVDLFQAPGGRSRGCAIVEYETPREAHVAISNLHDTELMGRMIFVREDREEVRTRGDPTRTFATAVIVGFFRTSARFL